MPEVDAVSSRRRLPEVQRQKDALICAIAEQFDTIRRRRGMTIAALACASGVAKSCIIRQWKALCNPTIETLAALAEALDGRLEIRFVSNRSSDEPAEPSNR